MDQDWLAGRESDDGHGSEAAEGIMYGSDEIAAAATLSEMCQMNRSQGWCFTTLHFMCGSHSSRFILKYCRHCDYATPTSS